MLHTNGINGTLPGSLGQLRNIKYLAFGVTTFPARFRELGEYDKFEELDLLNNLTGTIPSSLSKLRNLEKVFLRGNSLTGTIPQVLCCRPGIEVNHDPPLTCNCSAAQDNRTIPP